MQNSELLKLEAEFRASLEDAQGTQKELLLGILKKNAQTVYGQEHEFSSVCSLKDFRARVPVVQYSDLQPYIQRMLVGEPNVLLSSAPLFFGQTSGTSGSPKRIPFGKEAVSGIRSFVGANLGSVEQEYPGALDQGVAILGQYFEAESPCGVTIGSASGFARRSLAGLRHFENIAEPISESSDYELRYYAIMLVALSMDLRCFNVVNPSTLLTLFQKIGSFSEQLAKDLHAGTCAHGPKGMNELLARSGFRLQAQPEKAQRLLGAVDSMNRFSPAEYWPALELMMTWQGGNTDHYLDHLADLCPNVDLRATPSGSSEAALLVPLQKGWRGGVPALLSTFFEFLPIESKPSTDAFVPLEELQDGQGYRLCVTNNRSLYRFLMSDVFYVEDASGPVPSLRFSHRMELSSSLTGEKLTAVQVTESVRKACKATGLVMLEYQVTSILGMPPKYVVLAEVDPEIRSKSETFRDFITTFEGLLSDLNGEYLAKRESQRLGAPEFWLIERGALSSVLGKERGKRSDAQAKIPRLTRSPLKEGTFKILLTVSSVG